MVAGSKPAGATNLALSKALWLRSSVEERVDILQNARKFSLMVKQSVYSDSISVRFRKFLKSKAQTESVWAFLRLLKIFNKYFI